MEAFAPPDAAQFIFLRLASAPPTPHQVAHVGGATGDGRRGEKRVFPLPAAAAPAGLASRTEESGERGGGGWGAGGAGQQQEEEEELFQTPVEADGAHVAAAQGAVHVLFKEPPVVLQHLRSLLVQGVLRVGLLGEGQGAGLSHSSSWQGEAELELTRNRYWRP